MFEHIRSHIGKNYASGFEIWNELFPTMDVIFTIPNGWELKQQTDIRFAAIEAGLMGLASERAVDDEAEEEPLKLMIEASKRISFVSEAEAAMVHAVDSGHVDSWIKVTCQLFILIFDTPLQLKFLLRLTHSRLGKMLLFVMPVVELLTRRKSAEIT